MYSPKRSSPFAQSFKLTFIVSYSDFDRALKSVGGISLSLKSRITKTFTCVSCETFQECEDDFEPCKSLCMYIYICLSKELSTFRGRPVSCVLSCLIECYEWVQCCCHMFDLGELEDLRRN